jgi:very-short-patch-repair endonuclease
MRRRTPEHVRQLSRELRKNQTSAEQELWSKIRNKQLGGFRFLRLFRSSTRLSHQSVITCICSNVRGLVFENALYPSGKSKR